MQHLIVGSGLIGSYLASVLTLNGAQVGVIARGDWAKRLSQPFVVTDYLGHQESLDRLDVLTGEQRVNADVIWLTVKCTALVDAIETLKRVLSPGTIIMCCQNGVGSHEQVKNAFANHTVLRVMVPFNVVWQAPNRLHKGSEGTVVVEHYTRVTQALCEQLTHPLLSIKGSSEIENVQWAKLQLNLGNGVNALANTPVKTMLSDRGYRLIIARLMTELLNVCRHANRPLPKVAAVSGRYLPGLLSLPDLLFRIVGSRMLDIDPHVKTSMWWDLSMNRATEKDALYGAVVEEGIRLGIDTPYNQAMHSLLTQVEKNNFIQSGNRFSSQQLLQLLESGEHPRT